MSVYRFCREWSAGIPDPETFTASRRWQSVNVYYRGRAIYSFGEHFMLGYMLAPNVVWLNGDNYSRTTARHQSELRAAVQRVGARAIIVPGSALDAAGVDYRTIVPVSIEAERFDTSKHVGDVPPATMRTDPPAHGWVTVEDYRGPSVRVTDTGATLSSGEPAPNYVGWIPTEAGPRAVMRTDDGQFVWHTVRHWLGDAVFTAERRIRGTWVNDSSPAERCYWISSFDRQERRPLYFLSQLPGPADSVDAALDLLAPASVHTARDMGRPVVRQGDIFAISTDVTTRALRAAGARFTKRAVTIEYRLDARRRMAVAAALRDVRATMPDPPARIYPGNTVSRGACNAFYEWWNERDAEWCKELIRRHAERYQEQVQFASLSRYNITSAMTYTPSAWDKTRDVTGEPLLGTAHTATEVATLPSGIQYARGMIYHEPAIIGEHRRADHARRPLGRTWHIIARNTVPVDGPARGRGRIR